MEKIITIFIKKYWILLFFLTIFTLYILPPCFQNNESLNIVYAEHVDTGSILSSILQMFNKNLPNSFYNQNIPYHTGYYGYPYNSIVFWVFFIIKSIFKVYSQNNFFIFPLSAKIINFITAIFTIIYLHNICQKIFKFKFLTLILLGLIFIFPEYLHYIFHIKPDILGLFFTIISFNYLYQYLEKNKNFSDIIKANVFGGLSILCKQPHIFIIIPLFLGFILSLKKGNLKKKIAKIIYVYFCSFIVFGIIFFLFHPYALIEPKTFLLRQLSMTGMTKASYMDNLNFWIPNFVSTPLLKIVTLTPIIFIILYIFKFFRNKTTYFLFLISLYIFSYLLWLSLKVGPMRFIAYLIPILPFSILIYTYLLNYFINYFLLSKKLIFKFLSFISIILYTYYFISSLNFYIFYKKFTIYFTTKHVIQSVYNMKNTITYKATKIFERDIVTITKTKVNIIHTITLPVTNQLYLNTTNTWQVPTYENIKNFDPKYIFIDFTVYWEKNYDYWKDIANKVGLTNEKTFINETSKEKNIVLFY